MPKSRAVEIHEWETLLKAVQGCGAELAGIAPFQATLECALAQAVAAQVRQDALRAATHEAGVQVNASFAVGRDAATSLRSIIKGVLGPRTEKLTRYGIQPLKKRRRPGRNGPAACGLPS